MNLYTYCRNNPLGLTDPSGRDPYDTNDSNGVNDSNDWWYVDLDQAEQQLENPTPVDYLMHEYRNVWNRAYATLEEAENSPYFEREGYNPFHWPGTTFRGKAGTPFEGCQASYYPYPNDPGFREWLEHNPEYLDYYDPTKAGQLDDETPLMGTYDYWSPQLDWGRHFQFDMAPHFNLGGNYQPGLTAIVTEEDD